jgi:hypothetical protein
MYNQLSPESAGLLCVSLNLIAVRQVKLLLNCNVEHSALFEKGDIMNSTKESPKLQCKLCIIKFLSLICTILVCLLFLGGCATSNEISEPDNSDFQDNEKAAMDSWLAHTKQELIMAWGPPTKTASDAQGGEILIYDRTVTFPLLPGQIQPSPFGGAQYTSPQSLTVTRSRMFYISNEGKVYHWLIRGRPGY